MRTLPCFRDSCHQILTFEEMRHNNSFWTEFQQQPLLRLLNIVIFFLAEHLDAAVL
jgi:hypothetical protein